MTETEAVTEKRTKLRKKNPRKVTTSSRKKKDRWPKKNLKRERLLSLNK